MVAMAPGTSPATTARSGAVSSVCPRMARTTCTVSASTAPAARSATKRVNRVVARIMVSAALGGGRQHLVGGGDDLGVELVAALGLDQPGDLLHRVDARVLEVALAEGAAPVLARGADVRRAGSLGLAVEVGAQRL